ncbi:MAG: hypothetical protein JO022_20710, partial [Acidobacteriaceae bacterium]|nr:hypothetical protein [Acidobacteriaceae bacterium]
MRCQLAVPLLAVLSGPLPAAKAPNTFHVRPVCGNAENGIAVSRPHLSDERNIALRLDALESRLQHLRAGRPRPYRIPDSLTEETQLVQQISNFHALAERALSDRVSLEPKGLATVAVPRTPLLLSFDISIDSQRYRNAIAEIEIAVSSRATRHVPTLITLLPLDKTYNVATLFNGGSAGDALIEKGTTPDGKEQFTIAKDYDTIALEKTGATHEAIRGCGTGFHESVRDLVFEWQVRPVLGRESVDSGRREVFALLSLPIAPGEEYVADVHVHTHWRAVKSNRAAVASFEDSARDELWTDAIRFNPGEMEESLRPQVLSTRFIRNDHDGVVVIAEGRNFLPDTSVLVGSRKLAGADLEIVRERQLRFTVPADLVVENDVYIAGRFGAPTLLAEPRVLSGDRLLDPAWGLRIESARSRSKDAQTSEVLLKLKSRLRKKPMEEWIVSHTLVSVAGRILP